MDEFTPYQTEVDCAKCGKYLKMIADIRSKEDEEEYARTLCAPCKSNATWVNDIAEAVAAAVVKALREQP